MLATLTVVTVLALGQVGDFQLDGDRGDVGPADPNLVYDSGEPVALPGQGVPFLDVWHVLDVLDNLAVATIMPIELDAAVLVQRLEVYSYHPKGVGDKRIDFFAGTDAFQVGTRIARIDFQNHAGSKQGWHTLVPPSPLILPRGKVGVSFQAAQEFHSYWATNAPNGKGFVWIRPNELAPWFIRDRQDFGFTPNFTLRIYGIKITSINPDREIDPGMLTPAGVTAEPVFVPAQQLDDGSTAPANGQVYQYDNDDGDMIHMIFRSTAVSGPVATPTMRRVQRQP